MADMWSFLTRALTCSVFLSRRHCFVLPIIETIAILATRSVNDFGFLRTKPDYYCKTKETLLIQELKPAVNVNVSSEKLMHY